MKSDFILYILFIIQKPNRAIIWVSYVQHGLGTSGNVFFKMFRGLHSWRRSVFPSPPVVQVTLLSARCRPGSSLLIGMCGSLAFGQGALSTARRFCQGNSRFNAIADWRYLSPGTELM